MAGEEQRRLEEAFTRNAPSPSFPFDQRIREPLQTPGGLSGMESPEDKTLLKAMRRQGNFIAQPFTAGVAVIKLRPQESRTYFIIQNIGAAGNILIGFGFEPTAASALVLTPGSAYEPFTIPTNEIYVLGSAAAVSGMLIFSVDGEL